MPNVPAQFPNIDLPGAEFFTLAPNATIALGGRRRRNLFTSSSIPASSPIQFSLTTAIETNFVANTGIYLHDAWLYIIPGDASGKVQVQTAPTFGLTMNAASPIAAYPLGIPLLPTQTPFTPAVALRDQQKLIAQRDVDDATFLTFGVRGTTLFFTYAVLFQNTDTAAHTMQVTAIIIYTRLDGIIE